MILDKETALKFEETEKQRGKILDKANMDLQTRLGKLEGVISALLASSLKL